MKEEDKELVGHELAGKYNSRERMDMVMELREQLFSLANSFTMSDDEVDELTGNFTGEVAGFIHGACNQLLKADKEYEGEYEGAGREQMTDFFSRMGHGASQSEMFADLASELCLGSRDEKV